MVPFKLFCQSFSCQVCSNSKKLVFSSIQFQSESDNGYFDCKVLSRQHALLLYEDGKFFLMDTASSNGTFVNNIRYSNINSLFLHWSALSLPHQLHNLHIWQAQQVLGGIKDDRDLHQWPSEVRIRCFGQVSSGDAEVCHLQSEALPPGWIWVHHKTGGLKALQTGGAGSRVPGCLRRHSIAPGRSSPLTPSPYSLVTRVVKLKRYLWSLVFIICQQTSIVKVTSLLESDKFEEEITTTL